MSFLSLGNSYIYKKCERERYIRGLPQGFPSRSTSFCGVTEKNFLRHIPTFCPLSENSHTHCHSQEQALCLPPTHRSTHREPWDKGVAGSEEGLQKLSHLLSLPGPRAGKGLELGLLETGSVSTGTRLVRVIRRPAMFQLECEERERGKSRYAGEAEMRDLLLRETGHQAKTDGGQETETK